MLTYAQQILELTQWTGQTMAPSTVDNVIGRATIDYELKEAYQPSNFCVGHMVFRLEAAAATDWRRGLIKLHADNAEEPTVSHWDWSHWGTDKLISFCFLMASSYFWLAGVGGGLKCDIFIFIILQELKSKWGHWPDIFSKYFQSCIVAVSVL